MNAAATPKVLPPIEALRGVVVCCWALDGLDPEPKQDVPDGCVDLLFAFGERVEAMAIGVATRARSASRPARCVVGVTLAPGEALPILDVPLHELRDRTVPLGELWPRAQLLLDEMTTQRTAEARAAVLQRALSNRVSGSRTAGLARIRLVTKTSGFHQVRPLIKTAEGLWLVGDRTDGSLTDWIESEFSVSDVRWLRVDPTRMVTSGTWINNPDLSKVDEIGFADLMPSSGHGPGGWSDVGKIEVFAKSVPR